MALRTPQNWVQAGTYTAVMDRLGQQAVYATSGIIGSSSMAVTAQASPNMTVNVATGWAAFVGNASTYTGAYLAYNDATVILTVTTANASLPRIDRVVATFTDAAYGDVSSTVAFSVVAGTPNASPVAPTLAANQISLATIAVGAAVTSITSGNITDTRTLTTSNLNFVAQQNGVFLGGTATIPAYKLTSGATLTAPAGGVVEYDGATQYFTPNSSATSGRGAVNANHYFEVIGTAPTIANTGAAYLPLYGVGLSVAANTIYEFELDATVSGLGSTSRTASFNILGNGTATLQGSAAGGYLFLANSSATPAANNSVFQTSVSADVTIATGSTSTLYNVHAKGVIRIANAGTIIPSIKFSVATGNAGATVAGSYVKFTPISSTTANLNGASNLAIVAWA